MNIGCPEGHIMPPHRTLRRSLFRQVKTETLTLAFFHLPGPRLDRDLIYPGLADLKSKRHATSLCSLYGEQLGLFTLPVR